MKNKLKMVLAWFKSQNLWSKVLITFSSVFGLIVLVYLLLVGARYLGLAAPGNADLSIEPNTQTLPAHTSGQFDVFVNPQGEAVSGVELVITYDPQRLHADDIVPGEFFTDVSNTVGAPVEIIKDLSTSGRIYYAVAFPLGSHYSSTDAKTVARVNFTSLTNGVSSVDFTITGNPKTVITDINAQNVLGDTFSGQVFVGQGSGTPIPTVSATPAPTTPPGIDIETINMKFRLQGVVESGKKADFSVVAKVGNQTRFTLAGELTSSENGVFEYNINNSQAGVESGTYDLYVKADSYLTKKFASAQFDRANVVLDYSVDERHVLRAGDVDDNNKITIEDISRLLTFYTDFSVEVDPTNENMVKSDLNKDGAITIQDPALFGINWSDFEVEGD